MWQNDKMNSQQLAWQIPNAERQSFQEYVQLRLALDACVG